MIVNIYSIEDTMQGHMKRFEAPKDELAARDFMTSFREHPYRKYMKLWKVAKVDESNGVVEPIPHELICGSPVEERSSQDGGENSIQNDGNIRPFTD